MARVDQDWGVGERQDGNAKEEEAGGEKKERRLGGKRERSSISKVPIGYRQLFQLYCSFVLDKFRIHPESATLMALCIGLGFLVPQQRFLLFLLTNSKCCIPPLAASARMTCSSPAPAAVS